MSFHHPAQRSHWPAPILRPSRSSFPVGSIMPFAGRLAGPDGTAPPEHLTDNIEAWGWMLCDGRSLSCGQFIELHACLGELYGSTGDGFFNLPDLRGYFLRGADPDGKVDGDAHARKLVDGRASSSVGSVQEDALRDHVHLAQPGGMPTPAGPAQAPTKVAAVDPPVPAGTAAGGLTSPSETRPKNISVHYLIRITNRLQLG